VPSRPCPLRRGRSCRPARSPATTRPDPRGPAPSAKRRTRQPGPARPVSAACAGTWTGTAGSAGRASSGAPQALQHLRRLAARPLGDRHHRVRLRHHRGHREREHDRDPVPDEMCSLVGTQLSPEPRSHLTRDTPLRPHRYRPRRQTVAMLRSWIARACESCAGTVRILASGPCSSCIQNTAAGGRARPPGARLPHARLHGRV